MRKEYLSVIKKDTYEKSYILSTELIEFFIKDPEGYFKDYPTNLGNHYVVCARSIDSEYLIIIRENEQNYMKHIFKSVPEKFHEYFKIVYLKFDEANRDLKRQINYLNQPEVVVHENYQN